MKKETLLFVDVDTQEDFIAADGRLSVPGADDLRETFALLTRFAAAAGIPILSSADAHPPDDPEFAQFPPHCVVGTDGAAKVPGTTLDGAVSVPPDGSGLPDARPAQVVLLKTTFSLFSNPASDEYLERFRPDRAVVYGVATDYCVRQAVEGLLARVVSVTLVTDAIAGVTIDGARDALERMRDAGVHFAESAEIVGTSWRTGVRTVRTA
jgi:nicotinamidase/pyrazinamidase